MILYHGSNVAVEEPKIIKSEIGRDFGCGFYTTDIKEQAIRWAVRKAQIINHKTTLKYDDILNSYTFDMQKAKKVLLIKQFNEPSMEWLEFIVQCRGDINFTHNYDVVIGNIADDNVGETVSYVMQGIMRKEDAVERLKFEKINNQICFHTQAAIQYLNFTKYIPVKGDWK